MSAVGMSRGGADAMLNPDAPADGGAAALPRGSTDSERSEGYGYALEPGGQHRQRSQGPRSLRSRVPVRQQGDKLGPRPAGCRAVRVRAWSRRLVARLNVFKFERGGGT